MVGGGYGKCMGAKRLIIVVAYTYTAKNCALKKNLIFVMYV